MREYEKDLSRPNVSPGMRRLMEGQIGNLKMLEMLRLKKRGKTITGNVRQAGKT